MNYVKLQENIAITLNTYFISKGVVRPCIWDNQNNDMPEVYCSLFLSPFTQNKSTPISELMDGDLYDIYAAQNATLRIQTYGGFAIQELIDLRNAIEFNFLSMENMVFQIGSPGVTDITQLQNADMVQRGVVDFTIEVQTNYGDTNYNDLGIISNVNIERVL